MPEWTVLAVGFLTVAAAVWASAHSLLRKRDPRAAIGWIAFSILFPLIGPLAYYLFGINRVKTRATKLVSQSPYPLVPGSGENGAGQAAKETPAVPEGFSELARISDAVAGRPLLTGNRVDVLNNGEETYPAMLEAIEAAEQSVVLTTYIFDTDETGRRFIEALGRARNRGVDVKVLIDGIGELYSGASASRLLRKRGVEVARFLPPRLLPPAVHINLRNHRKILAVDGRIGFTGGMNLSGRHLAGDEDNKRRVVDLHFRVQGPIVGELERVFYEDWCFTTHQEPPVQSPERGVAGESACRAITDGPNEDLDRLPMVLQGAVSAAQSRVLIMTPYFLPPPGLVGTLQAAALRGVEVNVLLPGLNNLPYMHWATRNMLWELLERGVRVFYQPAPFVHSKLFVVDDHYSLIGSANLDARSLRLNFELVVEVYSDDFGQRLACGFDAARAKSREVTLEELESRSLSVRARDAFAWLFSPYL